MIGALFWISSPSIIHGWKSTKLDCLWPSAPRTMQKHSALVRTSMDFDSAVKLKLYEMVARNAVMPDSAEIAGELGEPIEAIEESFKRLTAKRLLVLEPGSDSQIRMAPPFSGIPTAFQVETEGKSYYANCAWDAFGVAAALHADAAIQASDGFTGEPIQLAVKDGKPVPAQAVAHFAVPAAHWWDDIIFT